jgi:hypothetical protein
MEKWSEIRINSDVSLLQIVKKLPYAKDNELFGHITSTNRIRYLQGEHNWCNCNYSESITFHTHPANYKYTNVPSIRDIYNFLKSNKQVTIIVGDKVIWVIKSTVKSKQIAKSIAKWENIHLIDWFSKRANIDADKYFRFILSKFGFNQPHTAKTNNWLKQIKKLHLSIKLIEKNDQETSS